MTFHAVLVNDELHMIRMAKPNTFCHFSFVAMTPAGLPHTTGSQRETGRMSPNRTSWANKGDRGDREEGEEVGGIPFCVGMVSFSQRKHK